jgi:small subunit ribosomal protein S7
MIVKKFVKDRFINKIFVHGKKQRSEKELLRCFKSLQRSQKNKCSIEIFKLSLKNASPFFQLKTIKSKARKTSIEIPYLLSEELRIFYGIKNLLTSSNILKKKNFYRRLTDELILASNLKGQSIKNKKTMHEQAFLLRKFARYRWF